MDLQHRGLGGFANRVMNRYLDRTGDDDGLAALPLLMSLRAGVRAHVTAAALDAAAPDPATAAEARRYLDLALRLLQPAPPRLVAIGGLSGAGKSTLALALAPDLGLPPGARVLRSDVIRKGLSGVAPETRLPQGAYGSDMTRRVYEALRRKGATALAAGYAAILDAVALRPEERAAFAAVARAAGVPFTGFWLEAPAAVMAARLGARHGDASDATAAVLARQLQQDPGPIDWTRLDAAAGPEACLAAARRLL
jgi:predicted kinase